MADQLADIRRAAQQRWEEQQRAAGAAPAAPAVPAAAPQPAPAAVAPTAPAASQPALGHSESSARHSERLVDSEEYQTLLREHAAEKERELHRDAAPVRAPDDYFSDTLLGPSAEQNQEAQTMLAAIQQQMADFGLQHGLAMPALTFDDAEIDAEIDASLTAAGHDLQGGSNFLQMFDGHGQPVQFAGGWIDGQAVDGADGYAGTPAEVNAPELFELFSITSVLSTAEQLPPDAKHCAICHELFHNGETVRRLNCCHVFHTHCIDQWLVRRTSCPVCKHVFHPHTDKLQHPLLHGKEAELVMAC